MPEEKRIPAHVALIVDGNRRWAKQRHLPASLGHKAGFDRLTEITRYAIKDCGVHTLSLYVFSTENFHRDSKEVNFLMDLLVNNYRAMTDEMIERGCRILFSGRRENLQPRVLAAMDYMMDATRDKDKGVVNFCLNYGGHAELADAAKAIARRDAAARGHRRKDDGAPPVQRPAAGRFDDPHQRRAAAVELFAVAVRLCGVLLHADAVPRF